MMENAKHTLRERSYKFGLAVIGLLDIMPNNRGAWVLGDQMIRAGTSIGANLVEASAASTRLEFKKYYEIALKSANETKYWLHLVKDSKMAKESIIDKLLAEVSELANMIGSSVIKLKTKL